MAIPTSYLVSIKNLSGILNSIKTARAPERFTIRFLEELGFKSNADRLILGVLKALNFLNDNGKPTERYFEFLDQTQSEIKLAEGIKEAYEDLFRVNVKANEMTQVDIRNKLKTLTEGKYSENVIGFMARTFNSLCKLADFKTLSKPKPKRKEAEGEKKPSIPEDELKKGKGLEIGGLVYNIQLVLPKSTDRAVYDALFKSLRDHLR